MKTRLFSIVAIFLTGLLLLAMGLTEPVEQDPWDIPSKYKKMKNPYADVSDKEQIGRVHYAQHCKSCHGTKGRGDGKKAANLDTPTGDFTVASFKEQSDGEIYYKSFIGRGDMPNFEKKIKDDEDRWLIVNYIRTLK